MTRIHRIDLGQPDGTPTVLAHCFLGHSGAWARLVEAMSHPLAARAFDMPGHGRSPMPAAPGDFHAEVTALIDGMVTRPTLLIGHSFGGASALRFAVRNPQRVRGLVLIEPVFFAVARDEPEYAAYCAQTAPMDTALLRGDFDTAAQEFYAFNDSSRDWLALPEAARRQMIRQIALLPATMAGVIDDSGGLLAPGLIEGLAVPVLLIAGEKSPDMFRAVVRVLADRLPQAEVAIIPDAGHMAPMTHAAQVAARIDAWMAGHPQIQTANGENKNARVG